MSAGIVLTTEQAELLQTLLPALQQAQEPSASSSSRKELDATSGFKYTTQEMFTKRAGRSTPAQNFLLVRRWHTTTLL